LETRSPELALVPGDRTVANGFYAAPLRRYMDAFGGANVRVWLFDDLSDRPAETMAEVFTYLGVSPDVGVDAAEVFNQAYVPRDGPLRWVTPSKPIQDRIRGAVPATVRRPLRRAWRRMMAAPPQLPPALEASLRELFRPDVAQVEALIDRDLAAWTRSGSSP
jgi:hypothetical protein